MSFFNPPGGSGSGFASFPVVTGDPSNPFLGQVWYNSTTGLPMIYTAAGKVPFEAQSYPVAGPQLDGLGISANGTGTLLNASIVHVANVVIAIFVWSAIGASISSVTVDGNPATLHGGLGVVIGGVSTWAIAVSASGTSAIAITFTAPTQGAFCALSIKNSSSLATFSHAEAISHDSTSATTSLTMAAGPANAIILQGGIGSGSSNVSLPIANDVAHQGIAAGHAGGTLDWVMYLCWAGNLAQPHNYSNTVTANGPGPCFVGCVALGVSP